MKKIPELPKMVVEDEARVITLVCYLLEYLGGLSEGLLLEIVTVEGIVPPFALTGALTVIENKELAILSPETGFYKITDVGREWLGEFETSLAITLRRKMLREGKDVLRLSALKKAVHWGVTETSGGDYVFSAVFLHETGEMDGKPIMEIKLYSKTREGAVKAQEKFLQDPAKALTDTIGNLI